MTSAISDPNESQATQLLNELLANVADSSKLSIARDSELKSHSIDTSSDSLPSSRLSNSVPQYHFHGLASTQTQSQHLEDEEEVNVGSQKENVGAQKSNKGNGDIRLRPSSRSNSPVASSSRGAQNNGLHGGNRASANINYKVRYLIYQ